MPKATPRIITTGATNPTAPRCRTKETFDPPPSAAATVDSATASPVLSAVCPRDGTVLTLDFSQGQPPEEEEEDGVEEDMMGDEAIYDAGAVAAAEGALCSLL